MPEAFCETRGHWAQECQQITDTRERIGKLKATNRCILYLNRGYAVRQCAKKRKIRRTVSTFYTTFPFAMPTRQTIHRSFRRTCPSARSTLPCPTYLQTARVQIVGPTGLRKLARCVLDSGIQSNFVSTSIIDALKLDLIDQRNLGVSALNRRLLRQARRDNSAWI